MTVGRVGREELRITLPDARTLVAGCDSYAGVLSVWLVPGQRCTDGSALSAEDSAWVERAVAEYAERTGYRLSVNRT